MEKTPRHIIAILCGGTGPRLWPLSRVNYPKQFISIFSKKSLLQETWDRCSQIVSPSNIYIITNHQYATEIKKQIPNLDYSHIISEPDKKNTTLALTYFSSLIYQEDPEAIITSLPSDHHISDLKSFTKILNQAYDLAKLHQKIVLIGKKPTFPNPSYGYIVGTPIVKKFVEKPKDKLLLDLIKQGAFWNLGIYTFSPKTLLSELSITQKRLFPLYQQLFNPQVSQKIINKVYQDAPNIAIDNSISELSANLISLIYDSDWSDIGEWGSIYKTLPTTKSTIKSISNSTTVSLNSSNCLVSTTGKKIIGLNGVSNLAIIDTPDALLISNLDESLNVRNLVGEIVSNKKTEKYFLKKDDHTTQ